MPACAVSSRSSGPTTATHWRYSDAWATASPGSSAPTSSSSSSCSPEWIGHTNAISPSARHRSAVTGLMGECVRAGRGEESVVRGGRLAAGSGTVSLVVRQRVGAVVGVQPRAGRKQQCEQQPVERPPDRRAESPSSARATAPAAADTAPVARAAAAAAASIGLTTPPQAGAIRRRTGLAPTVANRARNAAPWKQQSIGGDRVRRNPAG